MTDKCIHSLLEYSAFRSAGKVSQNLAVYAQFSKIHTIVNIMRKTKQRENIFIEENGK